MTNDDTVDAYLGVDHGMRGGMACSLFTRAGLDGDVWLHIRSWVDYDRSPATMQRARKRRRRRSSRDRRGY